MAFSYNNSLSSDRDRVRFLISDTDSTNVIYQDSELDGVLGIDSNFFRAAAVALRARATSFIEKAILYSVGAGGRSSILSVDRREIIRNFNLLIESYEARAETPAEGFDRFDFNTDIFGRDRSRYQGDNNVFNDWDI